ncbi:MAG TPA: hypothetical protein VNW92_18485, partial [Polyangiaceae bacterium]|nr:hypothetical protein [Polyangiaceae bacterium]
MVTQPQNPEESLSSLAFTRRRGRLTSLGLIALGAFLLTGLTGCGNPIARKLEGRWLGESVENFDAKDVAAATGWARGLSLEFSGTHLT